MKIQETDGSDIDEIKLANLSKTVNAYSIGYIIGNKTILSKGMGLML